MRKVLVIDDEQTTLTMFRFMLSAYGYAVQVADNGAAGLEIVKHENPEIVFTDLKMPGMDGFEVLKRVKEIDPEIEVIITTGHGDNKVLAARALNLDAAGFLDKPIQREALEAALKRAEDRLTSAAPQATQVSVEVQGDVRIMYINGDVTSSSERTLIEAYEEISDHGATRILMHFQENSSINGAGIAVLIQILTESNKKNQRIAISGLSDSFMKMFDTVGITRLIRLFDSEEDALRHLTQP